ncbi:MAG: 30S ribosomal protein S21 [Nitrospirae bacterium CG_4_10_14_0_8_um_filter_41_23]|nr:MAG: 30S ribosomal protein S21 [Nitrospirae bacterium CG11_big_fil_rev_8_21_14_0_20_41_14]PIV44829.1 MAG: 30S ribosomal protein S21 [Nitrospirae bacterium CG02_land_8_20_14_3_00_41_53]PIW86577.1 MAG: 30S ribosomal protein S21 [Nitrospirae bacterium CG_4_8_14_3_um_filter_41_47]PIY86678.1 MAG: 30S ribosomal protein S21 [Nitrospirae bacterium CG_4_10_14_0_8_um_filter_41_23]PJA80594.1 MAG: 30S ribosomal protein S21 [Nitrospirae bacterium CG_4_9_14_3_um_filter_41_27]
MEIKVYGNDIEKALKVLKRELQKEGLFKEIKKRGSYEKPSEKERRKQREARKKKGKALWFRKPVQTVKK